MIRKLKFLLPGLCLLVCCTVHYRATDHQYRDSRFFPKVPANTSNSVTLEGADLGRHLFYDPVLSSDSSLSCASCHKQQFAFSDSPNAFSKGNKGELMPRNTSPLFNLPFYPSFFWDGRSSTIETQVVQPITAHNEMNMNFPEIVKRLSASKLYRTKFKRAFVSGAIDSANIVKAIAQFERTLISNRSEYDQVLNGKTLFSKEEYEGFMLINDGSGGDCFHCHSTDGSTLATSLKFSNNGLDPVKDPKDYTDKGLGAFTGKLSDNGKFKIPSLRNVGLTAPYMHDGRFKTLEEVLDFYSEGVNMCANIDPKMTTARNKGVRLTKEEKQKIIAFLHTLTDSAFVADPKFSDPFAKK